MSGGILTNPAYLQANSENLPSPDLELRSSTGVRGNHTFTVNETIRNNSGRNYSYVQVLFDVYDSGGSRVESALGNIYNHGPYETWRFKAIYFGKGDYRYRLSEITGF